MPRTLLAPCGNRMAGGRAGVRIDDRDDRLHVSLETQVGPRVGQVVGHQQRLAVGRDGRGDRLAHDADSRRFLGRRRSTTDTSLSKRLQT